MRIDGERIFYSYSSRDEVMRQELDAHLSVLRHEGLVDTWSFREVPAGCAWDTEIRTQLESASIILFLVSASFLNSQYVWQVEVSAALQRHKRGEVVIIPVIIRKCDWKRSVLGTLEALPAAGKPVASFRSHDDGWLQVVDGIRGIIEKRAVENIARAVWAAKPLNEVVIGERAPRILAIEDDTEVATMYWTYFTKRGYSLDIARDGCEASLKYEAGKPYDVVILDLNLPVVSGEEWLAWYLAKGKPETVIIIASGKGSILRTAREAGVLALTKPFHVQELDELIQIVTMIHKEPRLSSVSKMHET